MNVRNPVTGERVCAMDCIALTFALVVLATLGPAAAGTVFASYVLVDAACAERRRAAREARLKGEPHAAS